MNKAIWTRTPINGFPRVYCSALIAVWLTAAAEAGGVTGCPIPL